MDPSKISGERTITVKLSRKEARSLTVCLKILEGLANDPPTRNFAISLRECVVSHLDRT